MTKWAPIWVALSLLFLGGQAAANEPDESAGRYQVIPDALVPGKNGQLEKRTVLLDSVTGLTWVITRHPGSGKGAEPLWTPIETEPEATSQPVKKPKVVESKPAKPKSSYTRSRLDRRFSNYDSDP